MTVTIARFQRTEVKLEMTKGQKATYSWRSDSADVSFNLHGEGPAAPGGRASSYARGSSRAETGELVALFDGDHGWSRRNTSERMDDGVLPRIAAERQALRRARQAWCGTLRHRRRPSTSTPAATSAIPNHSRPAGRSPRNSTANTATSTTLSLSTGATRDASPTFSARK